MKKFKAESKVKEITLDSGSVVNIYLRLRDLFPHSCLMEASDYLPDENCYSYITLNPVASFKLQGMQCSVEYPDRSVEIKELESKAGGLKELKEFFNAFEVQADKKYNFIANGIFGYSSYDAVECFESIKLKESKDAIPEICYKVFEFVIAVNHYKNQAFILHNVFNDSSFSLDSVLEIINNHSALPKMDFKAKGDLTSNMALSEHEEMIRKCKKHIQRGDIFQIVPSRSFTQEFSGDDFQVYRALRIINPSPYLFYFDFGDFRIFGSSPEAEILVESGRAFIHPIAGTCPNVDDDEKQQEELVQKLVDDPKENSEHVMLVDLARNDLNRHCSEVRVDSYREVQKFSHVIHLVSIVSGQMFPEVSPLDLLADTFPAGTLTGAPKFRAMELIDEFEPDRREFYGGAIGFVNFNGNCVHAIMIRTFLSRNGRLIRRAGGGVVDESVIENEVQEVENKLKALSKAIKMAEEM